ncbi:MAG: multiubiquitin domain-containing protein [Alphaproteobacteria bacterium]|nr:multiubiquitin domain-containing protein [Alphaproteobacteria bacterium]|tara:strand:- start:8660 stop:9574 length:915 start_codon:yes stop_codon:yes gene_type:complete
MAETPPDSDIDDLAEAVREGRPLRPGAPFRVLIGDTSLDFEPAVLRDPKPLGRQFVSLVDGQPVDEYLVIAILPNGDFEDIRLDETYDLRGRGAEKVLVVRSDRTFRFKIDEKDLEWPQPCISGFVLKKLAGLAPNYNLWLDVPGGHDRKIGDCDIIHLDAPGIERFISLIDQTTEGLAALPSADRAFLDGHGMNYELLSSNGQAGVIIHAFQLPDGKFDHANADLLILLPSGYPDCSPDMFYVSPHLTLTPSGRAPKATNVRFSFAGRTWQRWSRHNEAWRPGIDGLRTMLARVQTALNEARP